jgi:hypothetical protein
MNLSTPYEYTLYTWLPALVPIFRMIFEENSLYALVKIIKSFIPKYIYIIITGRYFLDLFFYFENTIINKIIGKILTVVAGLCGWLKYSLFTPIILFSGITVIDLFWGAFLNNIEEYKTFESKCREAYRIRWTDRLIIFIYILFPMVGLYGRRYKETKQLCPKLVVVLDPYFKYCATLSSPWPTSGFFLMPFVRKAISRPRGLDGVVLTGLKTTKHDKNKINPLNFRNFRNLSPVFPTRTINIFRRFKNLKTTKASRRRYFIRWNFTSVVALQILNRLYDSLIRLFFKKRATVSGFTRIVNWITFLVLFYCVFSSLQGKCAVVSDQLRSASLYSSGRYRSIFKEKNHKQDINTFFKFSFIFIIFFMYMEFFISLFNPFFLLTANYLTI